MEVLGKLYGKNISILIDIGATEIFINPKILSRFPKRTGYMGKPWTVEYANQTKARVEQCLFEAELELPRWSTKVNLYVAPLGSYDVILGINWLWQHKAKVDCFTKQVECIDDHNKPVIIQGIRRDLKL